MSPNSGSRVLVKDSFRWFGMVDSNNICTVSFQLYLFQTMTVHMNKQSWDPSEKDLDTREDALNTVLTVLYVVENNHFV